MGALHFLELDTSLIDQNNQSHELELFEMAGKRYLRFWLNKGMPNLTEIRCEISKKHAQDISDAAQDLAHRIAD
jgi:hypothetical protein